MNELVELDDGVKLYFDQRSFWHRIHFARKKHCGSRLYERVTRLLTSDLVFADVGANIGEYLIGWCRLAAFGYGFEIAQSAAELCERNLELNQIENGVVFHYGLSDSPRAANISRMTANGSVTTRIVNRRKGLTAQVLTLDTLKLRPLDLLKIDVEGHECSVLRGARQTILRDTPIVICEVQANFLKREHESLGSLHELLRELGYTRFENAAEQQWNWEKPTTGQLGDVLCFRH